MSRSYCSRNVLLVILAVLAFSLSGLAQAPACTSANCWKYSGPTGPASWATLTPWATCDPATSPTTQQSPINIPTSTPQAASLGPISFSYNNSTVEVEDNGHTIEADYASSTGTSWANHITYNGKKYNLLQFHVHLQSEHTLSTNGTPTQYAMELHLVHQAQLPEGPGETDPKGALLVISVLINGGGTTDNAMITKITDALSSHKPADSVNPTQLLPNSGSPNKNNYYTYPGSLTTPPCSTGVTWLVLTNQITIPTTQLALFTPYYTKNNNRPVQTTITGVNLQQSNIPQ